MPTLTEKIDSREWTTGKNPSVTLHYTLDGTANDLTAKALLLDNTPNYYDGLKRDEATLEPIVVDEITDTGKWACTVKYVKPQQSTPEVGDSTFSFETRGGTQHITQSLATVASYKAPSIPGAAAPNFHGAIGVTENAVEGVDIVVPVYTFSENHYLDPADVTTAYKSVLFSLTGRVNDAPFKGLSAGECLFLGAAGTQRGDDPWEIGFAFAASPNVTGLTVGEITGIAKKGWEYLWVRYQEAEDATARMLIRKPVAAYVERVYREGTFSALGIGV